MNFIRRLTCRNKIDILKNKIIKCMNFGEEFVFSVREQLFYVEKGFNNEPKRCRTCREKRKLEKNVSNKA